MVDVMDYSWDNSDSNRPSYSNEEEGDTTGPVPPRNPIGVGPSRAPFLPSMSASMGLAPASDEGSGRDAASPSHNTSRRHPAPPVQLAPFHGRPSLPPPGQFGLVGMPTQDPFVQSWQWNSSATPRTSGPVRNEPWMSRESLQQMQQQQQPTQQHHYAAGGPHQEDVPTAGAARMVNFQQGANNGSRASTSNPVQLRWPPPAGAGLNTSGQLATASHLHSHSHVNMDAPTPFNSTATDRPWTLAFFPPNGPEHERSQAHILTPTPPSYFRGHSHGHGHRQTLSSPNFRPGGHTTLPHSPQREQRRSRHTRHRRSMAARIRSADFLPGGGGPDGPGDSDAEWASDEDSQWSSDRDAVRHMQLLRGAANIKMVASKKTLQSLESVDVKDLPENERTCNICYNDFGVQSPEGINEAPLRLPTCKHVFGDHCIKKWFEESASCPYCRAKLHAEPRNQNVHRQHAVSQSALTQSMAQQGAASLEVPHHVAVMRVLRLRESLAAGNPERQEEMVRMMVLDPVAYQHLLANTEIRTPDNISRTRRSPPDSADEQERRTRARHSPPRNASRSSADTHAGPAGPLGSDPQVTHEPTMPRGYGWTHPRTVSSMPQRASRPSAHPEGVLHNTISTVMGPGAASRGPSLPNPLYGHVGGSGTRVHPAGRPSSGQGASTPGEARYGEQSHHMQGSAG